MNLLLIKTCRKVHFYGNLILYILELVHYFLFFQKSSFFIFYRPNILDKAAELSSIIYLFIYFFYFQNSLSTY